VLQARGRGATMIFTRTKRTAQKVADDLAERGFAVRPIHGDLGQVAREKALRAFRAGDINVLVATDVAARGIDIDDVTHVINYQCPDDEKTYIHRIGRTGRKGLAGVAITLVDWDELARWELIDKALNLGCPKPAETYSSSPHLYTELDIPTDARGTVGPAKATQAKQVKPREGERPARTRSRRRTRGGKPTPARVGQDQAEQPEAADTAHTARRRRRRRPRKAATASAS
jgi:superfamily II DNA/RNA helicase